MARIKYALAGILCFGFVGFLHNSTAFDAAPPSTASLHVEPQDETIHAPHVPQPVLRAETTALDAVSFPGQADEILSLPGKPDNYTAKLYSGFLELPRGGQMFYYLAMSQAATTTDPVLLWLNGGPGASSLFGCFSEMGPLQLTDQATLQYNPYAWNQHAHLLCLESPIGVGFSYNVSGVYRSDDELQAQGIYDALQAFYAKFPHLQPNDFIIAGESYGGVYVPMSARAIVHGNAAVAAHSPKSAKTTESAKPANTTESTNATESAKPTESANPTASKHVHINLKKWAVGNGINEFAGLSQVLWAYYHGLIGSEEYLDMRTTCPGFREFEPTPTVLHPTCKYNYFGVLQDLVAAHINSYDIFQKCHGGDMNRGMAQLLERIEAPHRTPVHHPFGLAMDLCLNASAATTFFNSPAVRKAMHADTIPFPVEWSNIALTSVQLQPINQALNLTGNDDDALQYNKSINGRVTPIWRFLLDQHVPGVVYHGDADFMCDFISGQWAVESLKLPRKTKYAPWFIKTDDGFEDDGGFVEEFDGLVFLTVKGAGHMVPQWKPIRALAMLEHYILGTTTTTPKAAYVVLK